MLIEHYYPIESGGELFVRKIAEYCVNKGSEVVVISTLRNGLSNFENINGVNVHRIKNFIVPYFKFRTYLFKSYINLKQLDKEYNFDIIHGHFPVICGVSTLLSKKLLNKKTILTVQGGDLLDYPEKSHFPFTLYKPFLNKIMSSTDAIHAVSKYTADLSKKYGGKNINIIPNGIDTKLFKPNGNAVEDYKEYSPLIITTSRLVPKNGIDILLKAIAKLKKEYYRIGCLVIGTGWQENSLKRLCADLDIVKNVIFLGYIENKRLPEFYRASDIFVRPSLQEGFGISFIEAMACGVATIGTKTGGIVDFIKDGETGLLAEPGSVEDLYKKLKLLIENEDFRKRISKRGCKEILENYDWNVIGEIVLRLYNKVISK